MSHDQNTVPLPTGCPVGLVGRTRLFSAYPIAEDFVVEDGRLNGVPPAQRHLRVIHGADREWWSEFIPQVAMLLPIAGLHVTRLLEVGQVADGIYLLLEDRPETLASVVGPQPEKLVREVLRQIALGLSHLHQHVPHGDLCLRSIRVNKVPLSLETEVAIADLEVGQIAKCSSLSVIPDGFQQNRPPEWKGDNTDLPTMFGDVYAIGLIGAQLLLGTQNFSAAQIAAINTKQPLVEVLAMRLIDQRISRAMRRILNQFLATAPKARPQNGQAALDLLTTSFWQKRGRLLETIAAVILVVACRLLALSYEKSRIEEIVHQHKEEVAKLEQALAGKTKEFDELNVRLDQKTREAESKAEQLAAVTRDFDSTQAQRKHDEEKLKQIEGLVKQLPTPPDLANRIRTNLGTPLVDDPKEKAKEHSDRAQEHWRALKVDQPIAKLFEGIEGIRKERKVPDDQYKLMKEWVERLNTRISDWSSWTSRQRTEEAEFVDAWLKFRKAPWDESLRESADQTSKAFQKASKIWRDYAPSNKSESWDVFRGNLETAAKAQTNPIVEKILNAWMTEFSRRDSWTLQLGEAKGAAGNGRWRLITVYLDGEFHKEDLREWETETSHDYRPTDVSTDWRRGKPIKVLVEGERNYIGARPDFIDQTFGGPVAIWSLHEAGTIGTQEYSLAIDVKDCPGPPRSVPISLSKRLANEPAKSAKPAAK